ncbi:TPA: hypothetical protein MBE66_005524 [Klebsiella pneumoniae]|jgi:hypothetical protein|uniref:Uncharacterized protein n=2 Tax=Klebsiella pneumoniae complex TaxID=3390273 RepID=A0ABY6X681_9ENTR|nr:MULTISPECIES: hypothetical protein [Enterobacteriaceae]ELR4563286.1 hypothetical protein [Salmonella enterica]MBN0595963.1 hypothetical protein [Pseudomonas aeruginosa]HBQ6990628.1 hypothetical protein [Klebsiella quasipneumoniae subsp. similipneumoniae]HBR1985008.1 hypothetical protein [Klebsiella quasipneumoniae subsp. quasipneumoniae]HCA9703389.1 hypothetical protein [Klebsiella variicola subsp. variicola]HDF5143897.1 hypothetical protein [Staphylococcus aureus]HDU4479215.1 hypothetica
MGKELSLNKIYDKNSRYINDSRGHELGKEKKVFDFEVEMIKKRREDAIRKIIEDSKSLKW